MNAINTFNGTTYAENEDSCPVHHTPVKKVYDFGMCDSQVITFKGCSCALAADCERAWMIQAELDENGITSSGASYHTSYNDAHGKATLIKMLNAAR